MVALPVVGVGRKWLCVRDIYCVSLRQDVYGRGSKLNAYMGLAREVKL